MRPTGKRSNTDPLRALCCGLLAALLLGAPPVSALDVFTLWRQPGVPFAIEPGDWVDYRTQVMAAGRREHGITRLACLGRDAGTDDTAWVLEIVPLVERDDGTRTPVPGEGVRLRVDRSLARRHGSLLDAVLEARHWQDGAVTPLTREELRENPLVAASLEDAFLAQTVEHQEPTTRVVQGRELLCRQMVLAAADTAVADLPAGRMIQETLREISVAVHDEVPFLGLVYVAERVRADSRLDPPSRRFRPPPPQVRVEIMELVGFGRDARPVFPGAN
jgi:hypothetical protein